MNRNYLSRTLISAAFVTAPVLTYANPDLIATASIPATYEDLNNHTAAPLENGVPGNRLGGLGSSIAYVGGDTFLLLPDRGPNAVEYAASVDSTVSYINRFHTFNLRLLPTTPSDAGVQDSNSTPNSVSGLAPPFDVNGLPFILTPTLRATTLLWSPTPLNYGRSGAFTDDHGTRIGGGAPALNAFGHQFFFTGRSDGFAFDASKPPVFPNLSNNPNNARLDPESIKVSNDGRFVFISDEYGPYVYEFERATGERVRSFRLPDSFAVIPNTTTNGETGNTGSDTQNVNNAPAGAHREQRRRRPRHHPGRPYACRRPAKRSDSGRRHRSQWSVYAHRNHRHRQRYGQSAIRLSAVCHQTWKVYDHQRTAGRQRPPVFGR
jgi:hypothetical protein